MSYSKHIVSSLILLLSIAFISCDRDNVEEIIEEKYIEESRYLINTSVAGFVISTTEEPISEAKISLGNRVVFSDDDGFYKINDVLIDSLGAIIKVEKDDFIPVIMEVKPKYNELVQVDVAMKKSTSRFTVSGDDRVNLTTPSSILGFEKNVLLDAQNKIYTGDVIVEVIILGHDNANESLPPQIRAVAANAQTTEINHLSGFYIKITDDQGHTLHNQNQDLTILLTPEIARLNQVEKVFELNEYKNTWYEADVLPIFNGQNLIVRCKANKYYALSKRGELIKVQGQLTTLEGQGIPKMAYSIVNEIDQLVYAGFTDENGNYRVRLNIDDEFYLRYQDRCTKTDVINQHILSVGSVLNTSYEVAGYRMLNYSMFGCEEEKYVLDGDLLKIEIRQIRSKRLIVSDMAESKIAIPYCELPFRITIKNSKGVYYDEILSEDQLNGDVFELRKKVICTEDFGAVILLDDKEFNFSKNNMLIAANPVGTKDISIQIFTKVLIEIDDVVGPGTYPINLVGIYLLSQELDCISTIGEGCSNMVAEITEYGDIGERVKIKITGTIDGVEINAIFTNYKFS